MQGRTDKAVATAVVIDMSQLWQDASASLLARWNVEVVAKSSDLRRAPALVEAHECDLLVVGIDDETDCRTMYWCLRRAHRLRPETQTIVLASNTLTVTVDTALAAGAYRAINRSSPTAVFAQAVNEVLAIQASAMLGDGSMPTARPRLTRRELEILRLVAEARSNRDVAKLLWVTDQTVKFHLGNIYRKLGVRNRGEASEWAAEHGLLHELALPAGRNPGATMAVSN